MNWNVVKIKKMIKLVVLRFLGLLIVYYVVRNLYLFVLIKIMNNVY